MGLNEFIKKNKNNDKIIYVYKFINNNIIGNKFSF